jgi:signal recognition particle receptor subunit beta
VVARARRRQGGTAVKIVVTGPYAAGKTTMIRTISEITVLSTEKAVSDGEFTQSKTDTTVAMDFGRITIDRDLVLYLFGTPGQDRFDFMWEILSEGMLGYVLLIDASRPESLDESVSILSAFKAMAHVPFVIGYNRADILDDTDEGRIRGMLDLDHDVPIVACDVTDRESVKAVLLALLYAVVESLDTAAAAQA